MVEVVVTNTPDEKVHTFIMLLEMCQTCIILDLHNTLNHPKMAFPSHSCKDMLNLVFDLPWPVGDSQRLHILLAFYLGFLTVWKSSEK